jgi:hypothetical protein
VLSGAAFSLAAETPMAVLVDDSPFPAVLAGVDASWQLTFLTDGKRRWLPAADLVAWGAPAEMGHEPLLVLADGSLVVAEVVEADKERITADSGVFGLVKLPVERVAGIVFQPPGERQARDQLLDQIASAEGNTDKVILVNGDQLSGRLETIRNSAAKLTTEVGAVDVKTERIRALVFNPGLVQRPRPVGLRAIVGFRDGSRLVAPQLVVDQVSVRLTGLDGLSWTASPEELVFLQPLGGRAVYLSDLKAAAYRHIPYLTLAWPYRTDRNVSESLLRAGARPYLKGLGMHSASRLTYVLPESVRRFQAELAIDDSTEGRGSVRFRVFVDGREKYTSPIVRGGQTPIPISVDLAGANRLDLIVEFADRADEQDHANWLEARLSTGK